MAHIVDGGAEGTEGTETGIAKAALDINQWLKTNRLSKLKGYFEAEEIEIEDLQMSSEKDVELSLYTIYGQKRNLIYFQIRHNMYSAIWEHNTVVALNLGSYTLHSHGLMHNCVVL